ncbi:MAG: DinB family protein [Candidatus Dormibacteraceae bacterium]
MEREAALADFEAARREWESAFALVPDEALAYLRAGDDYALGGLQVHVNWVLTHYRRVLDGIVAGGFKALGPQDAPGEGEAVRRRAQEGLGKGDRSRALDEMGRLHAAVSSTVNRMQAGGWSRKVDVVYGEGQDPYPTSPEDILEWLRDHYREHVKQSADLVQEWRAGAAQG